VSPVSVCRADVLTKVVRSTTKVTELSLFAKGERVAENEPEDGGDEEIDSVLDTDGPGGIGSESEAGRHMGVSRHRGTCGGCHHRAQQIC
jgi:hypothetical protein